MRPAHGTCEALSLAVRATGRPTGNLDFRKRPLARAVGAALGLSAVTLGVPMMAHAEEAAVSEEVIIVTGSRIPRPNLTEPTAVTTIDSEAIEQSGVINVADVLRSVPSFGGSALSTNNSPPMARARDAHR